MSDRILVISPENLGLAVGPHRDVVIRLHGLEKEAGLVPGLAVAIAMSPTEARRLAQALCNTAALAEEGLPRT